MDGTAKLELWWSVILIIISAALMRVCEVMWLKPRRIRSKLSKQGIGGPKPTSFLHGNIQEMNKIQSLATRTIPPPLGQVVSHDWYLSTFPYLQKWSQEYGSVYMYSTGNKQHLYISRPDLLKELNLHKSLALGRPTYLTAATEPMLGNGVIKANGESWAYQRKLIAPEFFLHKVKGILGLMEESTMAMVEAWQRHITESEEGVADITVDEDMRSVSADIISKACFGSSYAQGKQIFEKLRALQEAMSKPGMLFGLPQFRFLPTKGNRAIRRLKDEVDSFILKVVKARQEERQQDGKSEKDLLQMILEAANNDSQKHASKTSHFIVDNCKNIYFAGHETTALTASWTLMLLALYPEWQECVRTEISKICGDPLQTCRLDLDTIHQLKTLTMVIQESMRLYGPAIIMAREAFADIKLVDLVVPKGIHIWNLIPVLHRDPEIWGVDAGEFKPERFANGITEACKYPQAYMPFGYGTRLCIGQTFAMLELKIILSLCLSRFSFAISPTYCHSPMYKMLLMPEHGMKLLVKKLS
ncbi:hypothetical protein SLA2020_307440 [Shorea laevis]